MENPGKTINKCLVPLWIFGLVYCWNLLLGFMLKNIVQSSSDDMDNVILLLPALTSYSIIRDKPSEDRYDDADFVMCA